MVWHIINSGNEKVGNYHGDDLSPGAIAKKMAKQVFYETAKTTGVIDFVNSQTKKMYRYKFMVNKLREPYIKQVGNSQIKIEYDVKVQRM